MSARLALRTAHEQSEPIALPEEGRLTIGSSASRADLVLSSQGVAELHCVIAKTKEGGWAVQDMGSEFGTILDGERVDVARLRAGQTLLLASVSLEVIDLAAADESAVEAPAADLSAAASEAPAAPAAPSSSEQEPSSAGGAKSFTGSAFLEIPGYSIQKTLGRGGMGAVFLARQDRLHRDVALKILSPRLAADTDFVRRFHREAQAAAAFNHPNVVTVYDVGEADGAHYLAMEYMDGESLEDLLAREGRLPWKTVAQMLLGAARGLIYAESRGIVHRDIKPSNLMLNSDGQVKLADLGLAQRDGDESSDDRIFGTPHFMPPEQIRGETVDRRSDIYSLGATGYRLLSGYTPFEGVSTKEILRAVLTEDFEPLRNHVTGVPTELTSLIERMIAHSPAQRPQSAESVVTNLETVLSGRAAPSAPKLKPAKATSNKGVLAAIFFLGLGAVLWFAWRTWEGSRTSTTPENRLAHEPAPDPQPVDPQVEEEPVEEPNPLETEDDDVLERLFESRAENELLRMQSSDHSLADRQAALYALAKKFDGTTAAAQARDQAEAIVELIRMESEAQAANESRRAAVLLALRSAADLDQDPPRPGLSLVAMAAVSNQDLLLDDEAFLAEREALRAAVCSHALAQARTQLEEARSQLGDPDPTALTASLEDLLTRLDLPDLPLERRPEGFEDLRRIASDARDLLRNLDAHRAELATGNALSDSLAIAAACHAQDGLERALSNLTPLESATTLESLATGLSSPEAKLTITLLAEDLHAAAAVLAALISEFEAWHRAFITDPRPRRGTADVTAIGPGGIDVKGSNGPERIEWDAFADQPDALHQLFYRRFKHSWTPDEERGIAVLLRHAAVLNTLRRTRGSFDDPASLKKRDQEKILSAYEPASHWSKDALQAKLLEQERAAASSICQALEFAAKEQWSSATSTLLYARSTYPDTLLLLMLSDGSGPGLPGLGTGAPDAPGDRAGLDPEGPSVASPSDPESE